MLLDPAASIIFSLRATEALLIEFYRKVTESPAKDKDSWDNMSRALGSLAIPCEQAVKKRLELLRKRRNKAMHAGPRTSDEWDDRAARKVMRSFGGVVVAMWRDYTRRKAKQAPVSGS